mgnify:CR=1 FL=1|jgi:hypothetical protein|tara:strand:+ start:538 stop:990 length:453 start_codon:yes stop_codon:yes gene_type:complete
MKKTEFKKLIKPIVHECIKESLMEEGLISGIIAEVVRGMSATSQPIVEEVKPTIDPEMERMKRNAFKQEASKKLQEQRETLMGAIGRESYNGVNLFEGTTPVPAQGTPQQAAGAMAGQAPGDAGVDIGSLFGSVGNNWNAHMNNVKKESR